MYFSLYGVCARWVQFTVKPLIWQAGRMIVWLRMRRQRHRRRSHAHGNNVVGYTLIEILIVVAVIGIIVAIAIPNLLSSLQRSRQKRTMADIRMITLALESARTDCNAYPDDTGAFSRDCVNAEAPAQSLRSGQWIGDPMPLCDGWRRPFYYDDPSGAGPSVLISDPSCLALPAYNSGKGLNAYYILSYGRDGSPDCRFGVWDARNRMCSTSGVTCSGSACAGFSSFNCDIAACMGHFVSYPAGFQKQ